MTVQQISIFVENKSGTLLKVLDLFKEAGIQLIASTISDTVEYGIYRIICSEPSRALETLKQAGISANVSDVFAIELDNIPGRACRPSAQQSRHKHIVPLLLHALRKRDTDIQDRQSSKDRRGHNGKGAPDTRRQFAALHGLGSTGQNGIILPTNEYCPPLHDIITLSCNQNISYMERKRRILFLWASIIGGFAIHSLADLMPLFWSENISISETGKAPAGMLLFMMTVSYLIPVAGIICMLYFSSRTARIVNTVLALFIALFCILHMLELIIGFNPVQLVILPVMAVTAILLAADSVKALKP